MLLHSLVIVTPRYAPFSIVYYCRILFLLLVCCIITLLNNRSSGVDPFHPHGSEVEDEKKGNAN